MKSVVETYKSRAAKLEQQMELNEQRSDQTINTLRSERDTLKVRKKPSLWFCWILGFNFL